MKTSVCQVSNFRRLPAAGGLHETRFAMQGERGGFVMGDATNHDMQLALRASLSSAASMVAPTRALSTLAHIDRMLHAMR